MVDDAYDQALSFWRTVRDTKLRARLKGLAMPPAYQDVLYSKDPAGHLQAVGRDAAGRLQYRYHPEWDKVREIRKARRLERLAAVLPRIRRNLIEVMNGYIHLPAFETDIDEFVVASTLDQKAGLFGALVLAERALGERGS